MIISRRRYLPLKNGITMVELIIATAVFSLFMISVFGVYSSSQSGFESGSWRLQRQKQAQIFLLRLKESLEKANHAYAVAANGVTTRVGNARPIFINSTWRDQIAPVDNRGIMYFSITTPFVPALSEFGQTEKTGNWKGVGLECLNNTLRCYATGDWDKMPSFTPVEVGSPNLAQFTFGNMTGDFSISLEDVVAFGVFVSAATQTADLGRPEVFITCELRIEKPRAKTKIEVVERITARVNDRTLDEVINVSAASFALP
ncbi:MAG: hypothetical protein EOM80_05390 [Erysipelotrichia bacterium]|nr:hypothetical protein [Erysipelotrichia bacterium]